MIRFFAYYLVFTILFISGCATLPADFERSESYAYNDTETTFFGKVISAEGGGHSEKSGFHLLSDGLDAFVARDYLIRRAERSIDVQYYRYHDDLVGKLLMDQLLKAATRGVRVRLLIDDIGMAGRDRDMLFINEHHNVEIRLFNPFSRNSSRTLQYFTRLGSITRRSHNKLFITDNQTAILGGRNIGDEYFDADPDFTFSDLDVLAIGPVVKDISKSFDLYWNDELSYPISSLSNTPLTEEEIQSDHQLLETFVSAQLDSKYLHALKNSTLANKIQDNQVIYHWGNADVVFDHPEKIRKPLDKTYDHISPMLMPYIENVQEELLIYTPYFVPLKSGITFFTNLVKRGVRVRIVTNSLASNNVSLVHAGYSKYRKDLLRGGVELYELNSEFAKTQHKEKTGHGNPSKTSLHTKLFVFDHNLVFIGSLNLDPRALLYNTENGIVLVSEEIACIMLDRFDETIEESTFRLELMEYENGTEKILWHGLVNGEPRIFRSDPYTSFIKRFTIGIMRLLPIDSRL